VRVLVSGGGTAGHVYPALAVAARFSAAPDEVFFVGTPTGIEARLVPEAGVAFRGLRASGFDRARPWTLITSTTRLAASTLVAAKWLGELGPDVVVGFGGYVSIPVGLAAVLRRIPLVLHEQNSVPGMANKFLSRWARKVGVTYAESAPSLAHPDRVKVTGNPVRGAVLAADRNAGRGLLGVPADATVLLAFGGSRGARHLNTALVGLRDRLLEIPGLYVVQVAGAKEVDTVTVALESAGGDAGGRWRVVDYISDMGSALAASDLVVARAGATSIAEITALGLPAVLVPYPYATDDHQTTNARAMVEHGAAVLVADAELDDERFGDIVVGLLAEPGRRATMAAASRALGRPDAADRVAALARDVVGATLPKGHRDDSTGEPIA
jgi:UDP-N-acetylglucosamine--N-acetylmuramyl-(pentapeptide) pyrophosphoryl-undecaprenol N-acetylglucosamine transferase